MGRRDVPGLVRIVLEVVHLGPSLGLRRREDHLPRGKHQGDYLPPVELLALAKQIEAAEGRRPTRHWGPRTLDIDLLFYGEQVVETPTLNIPHPLLSSRAFVLAPLSEVLTGPLPVLGLRAVQLLRKTDEAGLRRTGFVLRAGS